MLCKGESSLGRNSVVGQALRCCLVNYLLHCPDIDKVCNNVREQWFSRPYWTCTMFVKIRYLYIFLFQVIYFNASVSPFSSSFVYNAKFYFQCQTLKSLFWLHENVNKDISAVHSYKNFHYATTTYTFCCCCCSVDCFVSVFSFLS